jgi:hypothetical protein
MDDLTSALGFKKEVLPFLEGLGPGAVLIIDGLDALRSETSQRVFRELLSRVTDKVPHCAILASIRTFDLDQSDELQQLFFGSRMNPATRQFRQVIVQPFSDADLEQVAGQTPGLQIVLEACGVEFRELLRNPFNLQLVVQLLEHGTGVHELSTIQSQVQLLSKYWNVRVEHLPDGHDRKALLHAVVQRMVDRRALSVPENVVYTPGLGPALMALKSAEILRKSITDRLSFTHNIIFDFAAARLLLDEEAIFTFILQDKSRTIFYRPSLSFFFHYLWFQDRSVFWNVAFRFFGSEELPERARVVAATAIYETVGHPDELNPLIDGTSQTAKLGIAVVLRAVQAFGGLQSKRRKLWLSFLSHLAGHLDLQFVNEYVALVNIASETPGPGEEEVIYGMAESLLRWMWGLGSTLGERQAMQLADVGAVRVFPVVMKFFHANPKASRLIVTDVMDRFGSPLSGPSEAFWLAHGARPIIENDPRLAVEVYRRMFWYNETREDKTTLGGSMLLPLISNRRQDFSTARYVLLQAFETFLQLAPIEAARAAAESVNAETERERPTESAEAEIAQFSFSFDGHEIAYRSDFSEIWDWGTGRHEGLQLLSAALNRAAELLSTEKDHAVGRSMLREVVLRSTCARALKRLLEAAALECSVFYPQLSELLTVPQLISAPEITIAVGELLKVAYAQRLVSHSDAMAIENAISRIPECTVILRYEKPESIRNRLLMCIPEGEIHSKELRELARKLAEEKQVRDNKPYHQVTSFARQASTYDWMREQGADTTQAENSTILEAIKPLEEFERKFLNETPSLEECAGIEPYVRQVTDLMSELTPHRAVGEHARGTLYAAAGTLLKNSSLSKEDPLAQLCRDAVLKGAIDPSPEFNPEHHLRFDMPSWGGLIPRIESAQGLCHILWNWGPDAEVVAAFERLSADKVPAVRFQVAAGLTGLYKHGATEKFWTLTGKMLSNEPTAGVMLALVDVLGRVAGTEPQRVVRLLSGALERGLPFTERSELLRNVMSIFTGLYVGRNDQGADDQLRRFEADPARYHAELGTEIFIASHYFGEEPGARLRARELLQRIISAVYESLRDIAVSPVSEDKGQQFSELLRLLDEVSFRVFIALDVDPQLRQGGSGLSDLARRDLYFELKPVIALLSLRPAIPGDHYLAPNAAHNLMQTLNAVFAYDPATVINYGAAVCRASARLNYHFDPSAIGEMVKLVEHVLADHRDLLQDTAVADAVGDMLDIFVRAGWPQAVQLTFKLDQAIR